MARIRPVYFKDFGAFLLQKRTDLGWGKTQTELLAKNRGLRALTYQKLLRLEAGQVKSPDPAVLRALGTLYGVPYEELVKLLTVERYGLDGSLDRAENRTEPRQEADDETAARLRELETRLNVATRVIDQARKLSGRIREVTYAYQQNHPPVARQPGRRRGH